MIIYKKLEKEEQNKKVKAMLPPRDGFNNGVAFSVKNFLKENMVNLNIEYISGGNTLRLTNGLFYQNVKFKISSHSGQSAIYSSYFLIKDNEYTSDSIVSFLETSDDFYRGYLKKNKIKTAEDEVFDYYFKK